MQQNKELLSSAKILFLLAIVISLIGLFFVFEASVAEAFQKFGNQYYFVSQQSVWLMVGIVMMTIASFLPVKIWQYLATYFYIASILMLVLVFIPGIGKEINGASRWFEIFGFTFQPVEAVKLGVIFFYAKWMNKHQKITPFLFLTGIPTVLIMLQPDMGSTLILICIAFGMLFLAGGDIKKFSLMSFLGVLAIFLLILVQPYRLRRLTTFLNPESDPLGASFHIRQITLALGNGGLLGQGIGKSRQKYSYIPEASTDSIFAIVAEEVGFVGSIVIIGLYFSFFLTGFRIVKKQKKKSFEFLLAAGILIWISSQVLLNLSAVVALVPLTGLPLPLFSYGGSALVMVLLAIGIVISLGKDSKDQQSSKLLAKR